jgi:hypothetical protein
LIVKERHGILLVARLATPDLYWLILKLEVAATSHVIHVLLHKWSPSSFGGEVNGAIWCIYLRGIACVLASPSFLLAHVASYVTLILLGEE